MYNIIDQQNLNSKSNLSTSIMMMLNDTKSSSNVTFTTTSAGYRIDCAKECPCGVPAIPVPDQWLEVMVTGGFKVWHIIFIIIAFVVTIVVVYCCFHRCRIPRTKQEIEADLMRTNLTTKFRDYLQEFPNEPTSFLEALKKVQELEEKNEQDDPGTRGKRMGWLKMRGKDRQAEKGAATAAVTIKDGLETTTLPDETPSQPANDPAAPPEATTLKEETSEKPTTKQLSVDRDVKPRGSQQQQPATQSIQSKKPTNAKSKKEDKRVVKNHQLSKNETAQRLATSVVEHDTKTRAEQRPESTVVAGAGELTVGTANPPASSKPMRARKKRDKPNLSRTKAAHVRGESLEHASPNANILTLPVASHHHHHHHHKPRTATSEGAHKLQITSQESSRQTKAAKGHRTVKLKEPKDATVIQIETNPPLNN